MKERRCTHGKDECHQAEQFIISETHLRAAVRQNVIPTSPPIFNCQGQNTLEKRGTQGHERAQP